MMNGTVGFQMEGRRQCHVESRKLHALHVAVQRALHRQRVVRITVHETLRQAVGKAQNVLLTYLGIQTSTQFARVLCIKGIEVQIHLAFNV